MALRGNRGPGCATCSPSQIYVVLYPGFHRVAVYLYCVQVLFSLRRVGIAPPPISLHFTGNILGEACGHSSPLPISLYYISVIPVEEPGPSAPPPHSLYCTGVILVEACGHSPPPLFPCIVQVLFPSRSASIAPPPPPPPNFCWGPGLRLGLRAFSASGRSSREIHHFSTFGGGGTF